MVRINLLPWRQRRQQRSRRNFLTLLVVAFAAAVALVAGIEMHLHGLIDRQREDNGLIERRSADLDAEIAAADLLTRRAEEIEGRLRVLQALWARRSATVDIFEQLTRSVVPGTHLVALSRREDTIEARGAAESNDRVSALMRNLRDAPAFAAPTLKNIGGGVNANDEPSANFELTFTTVSTAQQENAP